MKLVFYVDGACPGNDSTKECPMGIGVVITDENKKDVLISEPKGPGTNNRAEYLAVLRAVEYAVSLRANELVINSDSQLVVNQLLGNWRVKDKDLLPLFQRIRELTKGIRVTYNLIPREANPRANDLAQKAATEIVQQTVIPELWAVQTNSFNEAVKLASKKASELGGTTVILFEAKNGTVAITRKDGVFTVSEVSKSE